MSSTSWENNQLRPYLEMFGAVPVENRVPGATRGTQVPGSPWWQFMNPITSAANNYAGLSIASNTTGTPAADTTAGNVVADAGFGGMQQ
jgi:hypothetical protein